MIKYIAIQKYDIRIVYNLKISSINLYIPI